MDASRLEPFLARLYVDGDFLARFLESPGSTASDAGLDAQERAAVERMDMVGLRMAADSFGNKRRRKNG